MTSSAVLDSTIDSVMTEIAKGRPDDVAIQCDARQLSHYELFEDAARFGSWLFNAGISRGDRVAIWLPNCTAWAVAQLAVALCGGIYVPINTRLTAQEADHIVRDSGCKVLIAVREFLGRNYADEAQGLADQSSRDLKVIPLDLATEALPKSARNDVDLPGSEADMAAAILYTSGTTGAPKGCMISHRSVTNNGRLTAQNWDIAPDDVVYCPAPLFFGYGSVTGYIGAVSSGAKFVTTQEYRPQRALEDIVRERATWFIGVPTMWSDLLQLATPGDFGALKGGTWGGAPIPRVLLERALDPEGFNLDLVGIYGLTEALSISALRSDDPREKKLSTVGRANTDIELRIVDSRGQPVEQGVVGEVRARGYNATLGYWGMPRETEQRFEGGWIKTGDLGSLDADGYLQIRGRLTELILVGGSNVYAAEVQRAIEEVPGVKRAGVVAGHDDRLGEVPVAFVEVSDPHTNQAEILKACRGKIGGYKVPRRVWIVDAVPLTATGKIHNAALRRMVDELEDRE